MLLLLISVQHYGPSFFRIPSLVPHPRSVIDFSSAAHTLLEHLLDGIFSFIVIKSSIYFI